MTDHSMNKASKEAASGPVKVAVVGAGIAGLTAALQLLDRGFEVQIYEAHDSLGGKLGAFPKWIWCRSHALTEEDTESLAELMNRAVDDADARLSIREHKKYSPLWRSAYKRVWARLVHERSVIQRNPLDLPFRDQDVEQSGAQIPFDSLTIAEVVAVPSDDLPMAPQAAWRITLEYPIPIAKNAPSNRGRFTVTLCLFRSDIPSDHPYNVAIDDAILYEHCYHLYPNWYVNFWHLMRTIGVPRQWNFSRHERIAHIFEGVSAVRQRTRYLRSPGTLRNLVYNIRSKVASIPNMFLWLYSGLDLVAQRWNPSRYLDQVSVHGFLRSRWYSTEQSIALHELVLSKAFSVHTYLTSAYAYRKYVEFSLADPTPTSWVLNLDTYHGIFQPFEKRLLRDKQGHPLRCIIRRGCKVTSLSVAPDTRRVTAIQVAPSGMRARPVMKPEVGVVDGKNTRPVDDDFVPDYVILAVPPKALADVVNSIRQYLPSLAPIRKLQSGTIAVLDLYFKSPLRELPPCHVLLRNSSLGLTFVDNSALRRKPAPSADSASRVPAQARDPAADPVTGAALCVAVTNYSQIEGMHKDAALQLIIHELHQYIDFDDFDIDSARTYLRFNEKEPLFINEVGSESSRPETRTEIANLFIAGDFCDNEIGIVSVESAVMSGLLAARSVQARARDDTPAKFRSQVGEMRPIPVSTPAVLPTLNAHVLKQALTPAAPFMRAWALSDEFSQHPERAFTATEHRRWLDAVAGAAGEEAADLVKLSAEALQWFVEVPFRDHRGGHRHRDP